MEILGTLLSFLTLTIGIYMWFSTSMQVNTFKNDRLHPQPDDGKNLIFSSFLAFHFFLSVRPTQHSTSTIADSMNGTSPQP